jgi:hypothetical protein
MGCGGLIVRYGALRMTQVGMLALAIGLSLPASGWLASVRAGRVRRRLGAGDLHAVELAPARPPGAAAPRAARLLDQADRRAGGLMVAGVVTPVLVDERAGSTALLVVGGACAVTGSRCSRCAGASTSTGSQGHPLSPADIRANVVAVLREPALRAMCIAMFSFVGLQSLFTGFFVLYLCAAWATSWNAPAWCSRSPSPSRWPGRIGWGWLASHLVRPATLLSLLGIGMAAAAALTAFIDPAWPTWAAAVVATAFSATAVSWHGVLLAEVARLSPPGRIGSTTGAVLAFGDAGALVLPLLFSAALTLTGGYATGFLIGGALALLVGLIGLSRALPPL